MDFVSNDHFIFNMGIVFLAYPKTDVPALEGATLFVERSEFACILGPSGCGKSTLLNILSGLSFHQRAELVDGDVIYNEGQMVSIISPGLDTCFRMTVFFRGGL